MTRKDFVAIADAIANAEYAACKAEGSTTATLYIVATKLADALANTNPRFNREKFIAACLPASGDES